MESEGSGWEEEEDAGAEAQEEENAPEGTAPAVKESKKQRRRKASGRSKTKACDGCDLSVKRSDVSSLQRWAATVRKCMANSWTRKEHLEALMKLEQEKSSGSGSAPSIANAGAKAKDDSGSLPCPVSGCKKKFVQRAKLATHCLRVHNLALDGEDGQLASWKPSSLALPTFHHPEGGGKSVAHEEEALGIRDKKLIHANESFRIRQGFLPCRPPHGSKAFVVSKPLKMVQVVLHNGELDKSFCENIFNATQEEFHGISKTYETRGHNPHREYEHRHVPASIFTHNFAPHKREIFSRKRKQPIHSLSRDFISKNHFVLRGSDGQDTVVPDPPPEEDLRDEFWIQESARLLRVAKRKFVDDEEALPDRFTDLQPVADFFYARERLDKLKDIEGPDLVQLYAEQQVRQQQERDQNLATPSVGSSGEDDAMMLS